METNRAARLARFNAVDMAIHKAGGAFASFCHDTPLHDALRVTDQGKWGNAELVIVSSTREPEPAGWEGDTLESWAN